MNSVPTDRSVNQLEEDYQQPDEDFEEYPGERYRALNLLAVLSLVFGALSLLTIFNWFLGFIPIAGIILGFLALRQIGRSPEEMAGAGLVHAGLALCVGFWITGAGYLTFVRSMEAPARYTRISFKTLQPDDDVPWQTVPQKALELNEKLVFLKGYMYPGRQSIGIKSFLLVPTIGHCKFCTSAILPTEMIHVKLTEDLTANFKTYQRGVGGRLSVNPRVGPGELPYSLEADYIR